MRTDAQTINRVLTDRTVDMELLFWLQDAVEAELSKEAPDCDYVDQCVEAMETIETLFTSDNALRPALTQRQLLSACHRRVYSKRIPKALVASLIAALIGTGGLLYTSPAVANSVRSFFDSVVSELFSAAEATEMGEGNISHIYLTLPEDTPTDVAYDAEPDLENMKITAVFADGRIREIPKSECEIKMQSIETENGDKLLVTVSYCGCACSIAFDIKG